VSDGERDAFYDVCLIAGEFKIAMIRGAARGDEVLVVNAHDS